MKKFITFCCFFYAAVAISSEISSQSLDFVGKWKSLSCKTIEGRGRSRAYHLQFEANGRLLTYFQHYEQAGCQGRMNGASQQSLGAYEVLNISNNQGEIHYKLSLHHPQLNYSRLQTLIIRGNTLKMCPVSSGGPCTDFVKEF